MRHDWHPDDSPQTSAAARFFMRHRVCRKCGARQSYEDISYDVMATPKLKQAWRPLVGRCTIAKRIAKKHNAELTHSGPVYSIVHDFAPLLGPASG